MDDLDVNQLITVAADDKLRMITLELDNGVPVATSIAEVVAHKAKPRISPQDRASLNAAWDKRKVALRRMKDNDDPRKLQELKKAYFQSIESYKSLYSRIYGA